jgi:hypothetical protein
MFDTYGRLSWNPTTRELEKIETQHADNKKTIKRHGGVLGDPLDGGVTAWKTGVRRGSALTGLLPSVPPSHAALDPGARVGIALVVIGAVLNTAASIGSLYLHA